MSNNQPPTRVGVVDFVVLGAQKSASTFLQDQLAQHPQIEIAAGETRVFEDPFYSPEALSDLSRLFADKAHTLLRGIKRPDYLAHAEVPPRLGAHLPDAKLLVVLREPIARAVSAYFHYVRHGFAPLRPVDEAFSALLADEWGERWPRSREILDYGLYGKHLLRYHEFFPAEQLLIFDQEPLTREPEQSLVRAFRFLGVEESFRPDMTRVSNRGVYAPVRLRLLQTKNRVKYDYAPDMRLRHPRKPGPVGWTYNAGVVALDRLVLSRLDSGRPPVLSAETRRRLEEYYADDAAALRPIVTRHNVQASWLPAEPEGDVRPQSTGGAAPNREQ